MMAGMTHKAKLIIKKRQGLLFGIATRLGKNCKIALNQFNFFPQNRVGVVMNIDSRCPKADVCL